MLPILLLATAALLPSTAGHAAFFHKSMWGFNVTQQTFPYDNRPVAPLTNYTFNQWWFHGHLDYPPNPGDVFELPAGQPANTEIACDKGATSFFASDPGGNIQSGDNVCPGSPMSEYHTTGFDDLKGCALAITYESNVTQVQPEDFTVFSINQTCVWTRFTDFQVPARMPPCPEGGCICAFFWIHSPDSGGEQNYMNGFRCNVTGSTSNVALAKSQVPRRCGADPDNGKPNASPGNCTYGAKTPFYWFQAEQNNMFEGTYSPPFYTDLYNFKDGPQGDIFQDSYPNGIPPPSPNSTIVPTANLNGAQAAPAPLSSAVSAPASSAPPPSSASIASSSESVSSANSSSAAASGSIAVPLSSTAVSVSTATVVSTLVVTVTAPLPTLSPASASSAAASSSLSGGAANAAASSSSIPVSSSGAVVAPPSSSVLASASSGAVSSLSSSSAIPSSSPAQSAAISSGLSASASSSAAVTTIFLNGPSATPIAPSSASVNGTAAPAALVEAARQGSNAVLAASASGAANPMCRRQFTRRSFRRRAPPDTGAAPQAFVHEGGLRGTKHLYDRSRLWRIW